MLRPGDHWIARYGVRCCSGLLQSSPPCTVCPLLGVEIAPAPRGRPALHAGRRGTFPVLFRRHRLLAHPHRRAGSACEGSRRNPFSPFRNARRWNLSPLANLRRLGQAPCRARSSSRPSRNACGPHSNAQHTQSRRRQFHNLVAEGRVWVPLNVFWRAGAGWGQEVSRPKRTRARAATSAVRHQRSLRPLSSEVLDVCGHGDVVPHDDFSPAV